MRGRNLRVLLVGAVLFCAAMAVQDAIDGNWWWVAAQIALVGINLWNLRNARDFA